MKKKSLMISLMLLVIFSASFMGAVLARPFYKVISVEKAHNMMFVEDHPDLVVIDIRPTFAFNTPPGHIPGAINVPKA
jgi:3-mercaptopyruvate sulfurtransferase SseA